MSDIKFVDGMFVKEAKPDFVKAKLSINCKDFVDFMKKNQNEKGRISIDIMESKKGKLYAKLDDWEPEKQTDSNSSKTNGEIEVLDTSKTDSQEDHLDFPDF